MGRAPRALTLAAALLAWLAPSSDARAQSLTDPGQGLRPFKGTVGHSTALQASALNAEVFGAVQSMDRLVLPYTRRSDAPGKSVLGWEMNLLFSAIQVPGECNEGTNDSCKGGYGLQSVDLASGFSGLAGCDKLGGDSIKGCIFLASAMTATVPARGTLNRMLGDAYVPMGGIVLGMFGPLAYLAGGANFRKGLTTMQTSFVAGGTLDIKGYSELNLGYLKGPTSQGLYTNITATKLKGFLTAALTEQITSLPFIQAGIDQLNFSRGLYETFGAASAYARKVEVASVQPPSAGDAIDDLKRRAGDFSFWTAHLEQTSIAQVLDLQAAYAVAPDPFLHQAAIGLHTSGIHVPTTTEGTLAWTPRTGIGATAGMVRLPSMPHLGADGGQRFYFSLDVEDTLQKGVLKFSLRRNDPTTLLMFPFAQNAWNAHFTVSGNL